MIWSEVDLSSELKRQKQNKKNISDSLIDSVLEILSADNEKESEINSRLKNGFVSKNAEIDIFKLESDKIFSTTDIKEICVKYKLRFLDSKLFKDEIPLEGIQKIKQLESKGLRFQGFKIIAPEKLFKLNDCNEDPLLFAMIDKDNYYLIHKWGNDLKWYRSIIAYPLRKIETLATTILFLSAFFTAIIPNSFISANEPINYLSGSRLLLLIWMTVLFSGIASYIFFAFNKSLSNISWNSRFFN
jgi:hypothetical protein